MIIFIFSNGIEAKITIKNVVNIILRVPLRELLLNKNWDKNPSINTNIIFLVTFVFSIILIEERKNPAKPSL